MQNDKQLLSHFQLHIIVFIWGFTAVLGALISIKEAQMVWYRMGLATIFITIYILASKKSLVISNKEIFKLTFCGLLIALHWIFFFRAINISNVSITLAIFSVGSFFAAILEPLFYNRKILWYEVFFGLLIIIGLFIILQVQINYLEGIYCALFSIFIGVIFTLLNGKHIQKHDATVIAFYEFLSGFGFVSLYLLFNNSFNTNFFQVSTRDWILIIVLASICSAYAFTASINVMKKLSPYTVMLTTNLEPVYGIFLAYYLVGGNEKMDTNFYIGSLIILLVVILNGIIKSKFQSKV